MWKRIRQFGLLATSTACWLALVGCDGGEQAQEAAVTRPVKTMAVGAGLGELRRSYPGEIRPYQEVDMAFQVSGPLIELPIQRGDEVEEGQLLARIDPRDFQNELDAAQAVLDEAEAKYARFEEAAKTGAISELQVAEQKALVDVSRSERNIKQKALDDTSLHAPFAGRIADRFVENFENVTAKQEICSLQDIEDVEIDFYLPEKDILTAGRGDRDRFRFFVSFDMLPGREFDAQLNQFATDADPVTQTYRVKLAMTAPEDVNVLPGMTCQVTWVVGEEARDDAVGVMIPSKAVFSPAEGEAKVWIIDPVSMTVSSRHVTIGPLRGDEIAITSGLKAGEMIAISGVHYLREGMMVRSMSPETQEATP
ncbi:MAG: efflux RND transporter periplasmic adaptor subunit [Phycisphaerales bacterium]|nr:MAG: efflux RND transporter periplasmic adaptor subunit [Phycisphaerales bacterium]